MAHVVSGAYLSVYTAIENGYFAKRCIDIELFQTSQTNAAMISGDVQLAIQSPDAAILSAVQGQLLPNVVMIISRNPTSFNIRKDLDSPAMHQPYPLNLRALRAQLGRAIVVGSTSRSSGGEIFVQSIMAGAGLKEGQDFSVVALGTGAAISAAFQSNRIDGGILFAPFDTAAWAAGIAAPMVEQLKGQGPKEIVDRYGGALGASKTWLDKNPAVAKDVVAAQIEGERYLRDYKKHMNRLVGIVEKYVGVTNVPAIKLSIAQMASVSNPEANCQRMATSAGLMVKTNLITVIPPCKDIIDWRFMPKKSPFASVKATKKK
jgi:ABC-type nitrate/sulfonate/bicarbonate transport system substrate-binding protein